MQWRKTLSCLSQVVSLFYGYLCLARNKHAMLKLNKSLIFMIWSYWYFWSGWEGTLVLTSKGSRRICCYVLLKVKHILSSSSYSAFLAKYFLMGPQDDSRTQCQESVIMTMLQFRYWKASMLHRSRDQLLSNVSLKVAIMQTFVLWFVM